MDKATRYFEFNDNPVIWQDGCFPVMFVNGKRVIVYSQFEFLHEACEISEEKFTEMKGTSKPAKTLSDDDISKRGRRGSQRN